MITIDNISYKYAGKGAEVFHDFSLELKENRIYGLLGENGTGKSTLLYLISSLLFPKKGRIEVNGYDVCKRHPDMLRDMFIVPEEYDLPAISLKRYVEMNRPFYPRFSDETLQRCLKDFGISPDVRLNALSMGQKKKVYMSLALATRVRLLLLDEPTNGMDIPSKAIFRKVVAENMADDSLVIISTHQVHDVESLLDHVLMINREGILLNAGMDAIAQRYAFLVRQPGQMTGDELYAEPSLQGNNVVVRRTADMDETPVNLEMLFNAMISGNLRADEMASFASSSGNNDSDIKEQLDTNISDFGHQYQ